MDPDRRNFTAQPARRTAGFTLIEVLVATALLGLLAGSALWALTAANNYAAVSRLYTGAETAAQNQIDLVMSDGPFNPQLGQVPPELQLGTTIASPAPVIYSEPNGTNGQAHTVTGTMTTSISKVADPTVTGAPGAELNLYSATVTVTFNYRGKLHSVQLNALRSSDI
jgi:prepilin-type N-terminal cleavage/methylation domain-containing protein